MHLLNKLQRISQLIRSTLTLTYFKGKFHNSIPRIEHGQATLQKDSAENTITFLHMLGI